MKTGTAGSPSPRPGSQGAPPRPDSQAAQPLGRSVHRRWRWLAWALAALVLAGVFQSYLSPHLAVDLASRLWACF